MTVRILITPLSSGTNETDSLKPGDGTFAKMPAGPVTIVADVSAAQLVGLQGYLILIKGGAVTTTVETAITALVPA